MAVPWTCSGGKQTVAFVRTRGCPGRYPAPGQPPGRTEGAPAVKTAVQTDRNGDKVKRARARRKRTRALPLPSAALHSGLYPADEGKGGAPQQHPDHEVVEGTGRQKNW